jgi:hypothetical protein
MSFIRKIKKHYNRFMMFLDQSSNYSYAQEGEDRILMRYFDGRKKGFYLDVGAHHPRLYSNTYLFYNKGWNGIILMLCQDRWKFLINKGLGISI